MVKRDNLEEEFLHLLNENFGILLKIAGSYSKTTHDREDLLSETVLQLWQAYPSFGGRSKGSTWLYRVALNTALNKSRHEKTQAFIRYGEYPPGNESPFGLSDDFPKWELYDVLYKAIEKLNDFDKAIILLYLDGKSHEEIGAVMDMSRSNVGTRIGRIKEQLKKYQ